MTTDPRGPIVDKGMTVDAQPGSVQAIAFRFSNRFKKPNAWTADWIWIPEDKKPIAALFRKRLILDGTPRSVQAWISADVSYRLWVNGRLVSRGPADVGRDYDREEHGPRWLYDGRDLTAFFRKGENVIAAEVFTTGFGISRVSRGSPGFLFQADVVSPNGTHYLVKSDPGWSGLSEAARQEGTFDLRKEAADWRSIGFDDSNWSSCIAVRNIWTPLAASEIPAQMEVRYPAKSKPSLPVAIDRASSVSIVYDRVIAAYPSLKIDGVSGATLRIVPGEREGQQSRVCTLTLRDGIQTYEYPFYDSFSVLKLEFDHIPTNHVVRILDVSANFTSQPISYRGSFECSDPKLNRLWDTCRWLTQICMQDHHLDSPNHQEPICDPGDYLIESVANYYTFGEPWLARQDLIKFGLLLKDLRYRNFHTSYSLLWLQMLMRYYDYTGDATLFDANGEVDLAPIVFNLLDSFTSWIGKNGLISEAPNYMFMDWVTIAGFGCHHPPAVIGQGYMTALYYNALADGARIAKLIHEDARVSHFVGLRETVYSAFNKELWNANHGLYRDGKPFETSVQPSEWLPADKDIETFSPHVNTLAVLYGLAPRERRRAIMDRVLADEPVNCQPYFTYFLFDALAETGQLAKYGPKLFDRWQILPDTQTFHEMWSEGDLSHAWGSAPLIQMSGTILGIRPKAAGFTRFSIRPTIFGLDWAKGVVPTPHGSITVEWRKEGHRFTLQAIVPKATEAEVWMPNGSTAVWRPGRHRFAVQVATYAPPSS
jgi:hypothetical protein